MNRSKIGSKDARVHCVVLKVRAVPSPQPAAAGNKKGPEVRQPGPKTQHPVPQDPTACMCKTFNHPPFQPQAAYSMRDRSPRTLSNVPPMSYQRETDVLDLAPGHPKECQMLLRKEVIQPHLPVRLPCYDLVLITDPTFDGSLHKGWATGFRCYRLS
jgi:hypothetical protein